MTDVASPPPAPPAGGEGSSPRRSHTVLYVTLSLAAVVALLVGVLATRKPASDRPVYSALIDKPAPDVAGKTIDGQQFQLSQFSGKWVLVNFFATWCTPCQKEHPEIQSWSREHADAGDGEVVAVVYGDEPARVRAFFAKQGGDWPVVLDDGKEPIAVAYGVTAPPESYLLAPNGYVVAKLIGGIRARDLDQLMVKYQRAATSPSTRGGGS